MSITQFKKFRNTQKKITMVTCYDFSFAKLVAESQIDSVLVGDSAAMTMHGYSSTVPATIELLTPHVAAVAKGLGGKKFLIADLPFMSYRSDLATNISAVQKLMQAGAEAVKLEGADGNVNLVRHLVDSGVPVMGHLGLTPQFVNQFGGFKVQGKTAEAADKIHQEALALEKAGCFSLVLECVPTPLADSITSALAIPTIGIGAGPNTDGQVLVLQDLLGLSMGFQPKFLRRYLNGSELITQALNAYASDVASGSFPSEQESYS